MKTITEERKEYVDKLLDYLSQYLDIEKSLILTSLLRRIVW
jgi:hypothetical protein